LKYGELRGISWEIDLNLELVGFAGV
jgi:hypothetical protein